jgi:hypothetical protein
MLFSIRPSRRFPVQCSVSYNTGPFQDQHIVWKLSCSADSHFKETLSCPY